MQTDITASRSALSFERRGILMKLKVYSLVLALLIAVLGMLSSCAAPLKISDEEALEVLKDLVPKSYDINVIFFGEGLAAVDEAYEEEHDKAAYFKVAEDCGYSSIGEIKAAAEKVYSNKYLEDVYVTMFQGLASESSEGTLDTSFSPRYREIGGQLMVNVARKGLNIRPRLEVISAEVTKKTSKYVKVETSCRDKDGKTETFEILLTKENDVWLLDSPTY